MDKGLAKIRHDRSTKDFPELNLEEDEYVEFAFKRAKASLLLILGGFGIGIIIILLSLLIVLVDPERLDPMGSNFIYIILSTLIGVILIAALITVIVYRGNRLYITNKHIIQISMTSPTSTSTNHIDLASVEDVSFSQKRLIEKLFGYGTFRLSTVGDETTYTFKDSDVTKEEIKAVSKLITEAKKTKSTD